MVAAATDELERSRMRRTKHQLCFGIQDAPGLVCVLARRSCSSSSRARFQELIKRLRLSHLFLVAVASKSASNGERTTSVRSSREPRARDWLGSSSTSKTGWSDIDLVPSSCRQGAACPDQYRPDWRARLASVAGSQAAAQANLASPSGRAHWSSLITGQCGSSAVIAHRTLMLLELHFDSLSNTNKNVSVCFMLVLRNDLFALMHSSDQSEPKPTSNKFNRLLARRSAPKVASSSRSHIKQKLNGGTTTSLREVAHFSQTPRARF